jgi:hypothetical protein
MAAPNSMPICDRRGSAHQQLSPRHRCGEEKLLLMSETQQAAVDRKQPCAGRGNHSQAAQAGRDGQQRGQGRGTLASPRRPALERDARNRAKKLK